MCIDITENVDRGFGEIYNCETCDTPVECLLDYVELSGPGTALFEKPGRKVFEHFASTSACYVVELGYFDLDYRSEFGKTYETSFGRIEPDVYRIHFFTIPATPTVHLRDYVKFASDGYLGYCIIRPNAPGTIGRSIIPPVSKHPGLAADTRLSNVVRTVVTERVQLFGISLAARGVPFMEQDGHIMRCAHVSAWICHFSAVLRGVVPRRATASFNLSADATSPIGRPYPSEGLTFDSLSSMLSHVDLPGEVIWPDRMMKGRKRLTWADRPELEVLLAKNEFDAAPYLADNGITAAHVTWVRENLTATVRRYLNSGIPLIVCRMHVAHTQVVIGYARQDELSIAIDNDDDSSHFDISAFITSDDAEDPFCVVPIREIVDEILNPTKAPTFVVVPLPRGLWLSGDLAETAAIDWFTAQTAARFKVLDAWEPLKNDPSALEEHRRALSNFEKGTRDPNLGTQCSEPPDLAIRTYVTDGADFKESIAARFSDDGLFVRLVGQMQLPKYIWVSEAIDRSLRTNGDPAVLGTIAIDATTIVTDRSAPSAILPLFAHLPGQSYVKLPYDYWDYGVDSREDGKMQDSGEPSDGWNVGRLKPTESCRWNHRDPSQFLDARLAHRAKTASSGA